MTRNCRALAMATIAALAAGAGVPGVAAEPSRDPMGAVFRVNPVQSSGDQTLTDQKDSAAAVRPEDYATVPLRNLDGSGYLNGTWVTIRSSTGKPAYSASGEFIYDRSQDEFEQVMAYFWVNQAQEYLQSLGFGGALPGVMDEPLDLRINQHGGDNSFQTTKPFRITLGKGGVDDAEDAEVIVHEYGHAIHADQVPGFGSSLDAGAIGEGFGDYLAVSVGLDAAAEHGWTVRGNTPGEKTNGWESAACVADWDATSYSESTVAKCLRRLDQDTRTVGNRTGDIHQDGMIWSGALWRIRQDYQRLGLGSEAWDTTMILAQFRFAPGASFAAAAQKVHHLAETRDTAAAAAAVQQRFADRGIIW